MFEDAIKQGAELLSGLNWTYVYIYAFVIYGIKMEEEFTWYNTLLHRSSTAYSLRLWIAGLIIALLFVFFSSLEVGFSSIYVATILRPFIVTIVFNSVVIKKVGQLMKKIKYTK